MNEDNKLEYHGARFYKCALQVNPFDYAARQGKPPGAQNEDEYNKAMANACKEAEVRVVALANHGDVDKSESLRNILRDNGILVFPGFEIASTEKIHMACCFPEDTQIADLNRYLGALSGDHAKVIGEDTTYASSLTCHDIAEKVEEFDGVWYAPHMNDKNGILKGGTEIWKNHDLVRVGSLTRDVTPGHRKIIDNNDHNYERNRPIAVINANDVSNPADFDNPRATCWIKMTVPTIPSLRQAFFDPDSRISLDKPGSADFSRIESIKWSGDGLFQNSAVALSDNLNAIIGGRGAGKSSFLESIRYVLMSAPIGKESQKISDSIVRSNLADSKVTMRVWSHKQKKHYDISRRLGEQVHVKTADGEPSHLSIPDILPRIDILGQNEIMDISNDEQKVRELLERFLPSDALFADRVRQIREKLKANRIQLLQLDEELENIKSATDGEESLREQRRELKTCGIEDKLESISHVAEERRLCEKFSKIEENIGEWLADLDDIANLPPLPDSLDKYPNAKILVGIHKLFSNSLGCIITSRDALRQDAKKLSAEFARQHVLLKKAWGELQDEVDHLAGQLPVQNGASDGNIVSRYKRLQTKIDAIDRAKEVQKKKEEALQKTRYQRQKLLEDYRQIHFSRFNALRDAAKNLNERELAGKLHIKIGRMQLRNEFKKFIIANAEGVGENSMKWLDDAESIDTVAMAGHIRNNDADEILKECGEFKPTPGVAAKIARMSHSASYKLEEVAIDDSVIIYLNLAAPSEEPNFRRLNQLSTGQKCTAILELFLLNRDSPLVLDQPEDHLDNAFIAERIAKKIRQIKQRCQLILSTHNANIPVFGDAELIAVMEADGQRKAPIKNELLGSIDKPEVKERVADILDGGQEAFTIRREKYGY